MCTTMKQIKNFDCRACGNVTTLVHRINGWTCALCYKLHKIEIVNKTTIKEIHKGVNYEPY